MTETLSHIRSGHHNNIICCGAPNAQVLATLPDRERASGFLSPVQMFHHDVQYLSNEVAQTTMSSRPKTQLSNKELAGKMAQEKYPSARFHVDLLQLYEEKARPVSFVKSASRYPSKANIGMIDR